MQGFSAPCTCMGVGPRVYFFVVTLLRFVVTLLLVFPDACKPLSPFPGRSCGLHNCVRFTSGFCLRPGCGGSIRVHLDGADSGCAAGAAGRSTQVIRRRHASLAPAGLAWRSVHNSARWFPRAPNGFPCGKPSARGRELSQATCRACLTRSSSLLCAGASARARAAASRSSASRGRTRARCTRRPCRRCTSRQAGITLPLEPETLPFSPLHPLLCDTAAARPSLP